MVTSVGTILYTPDPIDVSTASFKAGKLLNEGERVDASRDVREPPHGKVMVYVGSSK